MQIDSHYITQSQVAQTDRAVAIKPPKQHAEADKAATAFAALFIERMLNETMPEDNFITGEKKGAGEIMADQLFNRELSNIISSNSEIKESIKKSIIGK